MTNPLYIIFIVAICTFLTRALPFIVFRNRAPKLVMYLGSVLPATVIAILIIYCMRNTGFKHYEFMPQLIATIIAISLHVYKRNFLLSISVSTLFYMLMIQY